MTTATAPGAEYADTASAAYRTILQIIESVEPRIAEATRKELADQRDSLKLIASENYASPAVLLTMGTWLQRQVRRGHHRAPLLRRLPERRHRRGAGRRARPRAVRRAVRLRRSRTPASTPTWSRSGRSWPTASRRRRLAEARRQERQRPLRGRLGDAARTSSATSGCSACRWTPAATSPTASGPNISGKMFHQRSYGTDPETGLLDYDAVARGRARVQAAGPGRRLLGLPAPGELRQDARDRRRGRRRR